MSMASVARTPSPPFARHRRWSSRVSKSGCSSRPRASAADLADLAPPADPCAFVLEAVARATATDHFVISAERVLALAAQRGLDPQDLLPEFVREAQKLAIPPTSKFHVGAAALGATGLFLASSPLVLFDPRVRALAFIIENNAVPEFPVVNTLTKAHAHLGVGRFLERSR